MKDKVLPGMPSLWRKRKKPLVDQFLFSPVVLEKPLLVRLVAEPLTFIVSKSENSL